MKGIFWSNSRWNIFCSVSRICSSSKNIRLHIENYCILFMIDSPTKLIPVLQLQKWQKWLNINFKCRLKKKKRWLYFFVLLLLCTKNVAIVGIFICPSVVNRKTSSTTTKVTKKKERNVNATHIYNLHSGYPWSHE